MTYRPCAACGQPAEHTAIWWGQYGSEPRCICCTCYTVFGCVFNEDGTVRDPRRKRRAKQHDPDDGIGYVEGTDGKRYYGPEDGIPPRGGDGAADRMPLEASPVAPGRTEQAKG